MDARAYFNRVLDNFFGQISLLANLCGPFGLGNVKVFIIFSRSFFPEIDCESDNAHRLAVKKLDGVGLVDNRPFID